MKLIFIRHGDPDYVKDSLTEKGWREAEILSERVKNWPVKEFYCSPLGRAQDTASLTLNKVGRKAVTYDWLQEFYYRVTDEQTGQERIAWDFMPNYFCSHDGLHNKDEWFKTAVMSSGDIEKHYSEVKQGIDGLLASYGYVRREDGVYAVKEHNDDNLVFFCHFGITAVLLSRLWNTSPFLLLQSLCMAPTSVTEVVTEERSEGQAYFRALRIGDTTHLTLAGLKPSFAARFCETFYSAGQRH